MIVEVFNMSLLKIKKFSITKGYTKLEFNQNITKILTRGVENSDPLHYMINFYLSVLVLQ